MSRRPTPLQRLRASAKAAARRRIKNRPHGILDEVEAAVNLLDAAERFYGSGQSIDAAHAMKHLTETAIQFGDVAGFWRRSR